MKRLGWNYILANEVGNGTGWNPGDEKTWVEMIEWSIKDEMDKV